MALYKISASRVNNIEAQNYAGSVVEEGLIWYDPEQGILRLYNGETGGYIINSGGGGSPGGANSQVQFNRNGAFGGNANLTFDSATGTLSAGAVAATGNISAQYFVGNGSLLTGINTGPGTELVNGTSNVRVYPSGHVAISVNGVANVAVFEGPQAQFDAVQSTGNITTDAYFIGDGSKLTGIPAGYGNANVAAYLPTYTGTVAAGSVTATGNVSGQFFIGNGSQLTGIAANYGNANVASYLNSGTNANNIVTTGNIAGNYFIGNGALLTGISSSGDYSNANVQAYLPTYSGNLNPGNVTTGGNVTAQYFVGNGSQLTGITANYGNANVQTYLPTYTGNLASLQGNVTTTANISGSYILGNGSQLTGIPAGYTNANVAAYLPTYTGNLVSMTGDVTTTGNVRGSYIIGDGSLLTGIPSTLPPQTGNFGKYLYTNGVAPSWEDIPGVFGLVIDGGNAERASTDFIIDGGGA
jgi:hypothetical protein